MVLALVIFSFKKDIVVLLFLLALKNGSDNGREGPAGGIFI